LQIPHEVETQQCERLDAVIKSRDNDAAMQALDAIRVVARNDENVMDSLVTASLARCTLGEMVQAMADVFGKYGGGPEW
jgi:methylmalonyl-CoA mutase N-terminal domain/subunit